MANSFPDIANPETACSQRKALKKAWSKYPGVWKRVEVPAKQVLLQEGAVSRKSYLIEKGCIRVWFNHEGKDISFQFFFEGEVVCSVESFNRGVPSPFAIETIEPSVLRWIAKADLDRAIREDDFLHDYLMAWSVDSQAAFIRHFFSFLKDNPYQRYTHLLEEHPQIIRRVPLQYIASYLGITQVSLSRIRKRH